MEMTGCRVHGIRDTGRAAVEAAGAREGDGVHACIKQCHIYDNLGVGLRLQSPKWGPKGEKAL